MRRSQAFRLGALILLTGLGGGTGCINHYHYYTEPGAVGSIQGPPPGLTVSTTPRTTSGSIAYGSTCEVPRIESGSVPDRQVVAATPRPTRTLVSTPVGEPGPARPLASRFAWRQPEADGPAITRVEGAVESDTVVR